LHEETEAIKEMSDYITKLERVGEGLGVYQFDKLTLGGK
jgi:ferritin heavy chain